MKRILSTVTILALASFGSGVLLAQRGSGVGTWKLNVAKSKFIPGPAPRDQMLTIQAQGVGIKVNVEGTAADGSRISYSYTGNYDGKDNPISGVGSNGADAAARKRINANTIEATYKKAGKVTNSLRGVVSKDGKVMTITGKGTNAQGQPTSSMAVYDKQ